MAGQRLLIVIPARGASKGLPRKNARMLGDIPLLGWTAEAIRAAHLESAACVLSTDDAEIAEIGRGLGLEVPFMRPSSLATDDATAEAVALHALDWLASDRGIRADSVMLLQPTSPFRTPETLRSGVAALMRDDFIGALGVTPIARTLRTLFYADENKVLKPVDEDTPAASRRQEVRTMFTPNGALYLAPADRLRAGCTFNAPGCRALIMDAIQSIDIDDAIDWQIAEALASAGLTWRGCLTEKRSHSS